MAFQSFTTAGLAAIRRLAGVTVTYHRGAFSVELPATVGSTDITILDGNGFQTIVSSRDYLIEAAALVLDGEQVEPQKGDLIVEVIDGQTCTHQPLDLNGEPSFRYSDPARSQLRIHTKQTARA